MKLRTAFATLAAGMLLAGTLGAMPLGPHFKPKWSQPLDENGIDILSMHRSNGPVVADDFQSDGRPIAGFHWWGSYFADAGQSQTQDRLVSFEISFHQDCPAGSADPACLNPTTGAPYPYSTPQGPGYFSSIVSAEEDYVGTFNGIDVYEYWLDVTGIPGPNFLNNTWNEIPGEIYWVDFAWNSGQFGTDPAASIWGWHTSATQNLDSAVQTGAVGIPGNNPHLGPWNVLGTDMAFEVMTVPEPASLALIALGLAGLGYRRRTQGRAA